MEKIDNKRAFDYFRQDKELVKKIVLLYVIIVVAAILQGSVFLSIIGLLFNLFVAGYFAYNAHTRALKPDSSLPDMKDIGKYMLVGLKQVAGTSIPIFLFGVLSALIVIPIAAHAKHLTIFSVLILALLFLLFSIYYLIPVQVVFAANLKFSSFFNFNALKQIIVQNPNLFWSFIGRVLLYSFASGFLVPILAITIVGILAIPVVFILFYIVISDMQAQVIESTLKTEQVETNG